MRRASLCLLIPLLASCDKIAALAGPSGSCKGPQAYAIGTTASSKLGDSECGGPGDIDGHLYAVTLTGQTDVLVTMTPSGFKGALGMWTADKRIVFESNGSGVQSAKVFLPAGLYTIVTGRQALGGGTYTLSTQPTSANGSSGPPYTWTTRGAVIVGVVTTSDLAGNQGARFDAYELVLQAGESITVTATMDQAGGINAAPNPGSGVDKPVPKGGSATITYTAPVNGNYILRVFGQSPGLPNNYTVTIN